MKTKSFFSACILAVILAGQATSQVINPNFGSVKGWKGTCKVVILDSVPEGYTEYRFEGPVTMQNELDMSPYNTSWPNPNLTPGAMDAGNSGNVEAMANASKAQEDKFRVWKARVQVTRRMLYSDVVSSADYTCRFDVTQLLKFQLTIIGNTVTISPGVEFREKLTCSGTRDGAPVLPEEDHHLMLNNFTVTQDAPASGKRLVGTKTLRDGTKKTVVDWDLSPMP